MLGWEFPPFYAGGVGIVCHELAKSLSKYPDVKVTYVMPYGPSDKEVYGNFKVTCANLKKVSKDKLDIVKIPAAFYAYDTLESYSKRYLKWMKESELFGSDKSMKEIYGKNLLEEVYLYAKRVATLFSNSDFDVIHAHDWTTIPAALLLKKLTGKPIILHVHITEFDKTGGMGGHEEILKIEKEGFDNADTIISISNWIKNRLINNYGTDSRKIKIVHNGGISDLVPTLIKNDADKNNEKIVLFAGRITLQKGVEYFIRAAKKALEYDNDMKFIIAGSGDQLPKMIELAAELNIGKNILFYGFYTRQEAEKLFSIADVFVMPSVSEPFGIVPLEAVAKGTPTIISKQSGISEVLEHTFKVDFWDTDEIAHKMLALIRYPNLHENIRTNAHKDFDKFSWEEPTRKIVEIYSNIVN